MTLTVDCGLLFFDSNCLRIVSCSDMKSFYLGFGFREIKETRLVFTSMFHFGGVEQNPWNFVKLFGKVLWADSGAIDRGVLLP